MDFAPQLSKQVHISKIKNMEFVKEWIARRLTELGYEDDVITNYIYALLESEDPDGRTIQSHLTGLMEKKTAKEFMKELWDLLLSAQEDEHILPQQLLGSEVSTQQDADTGSIRSFGGPTAFNNTIINANEEMELDLREGGAPRNHHISPSRSSLDRPRRSSGSGPCMWSASPQRHSRDPVSRRGRKRTSAFPPYSSISYRWRSPQRRRPWSPRRYMPRSRSPAPQRYKSWSRSPGRHRAGKRQKISESSRTNSAIRAKGLPELSEEMLTSRRMKKQTDRDASLLKDRNNSAQGFSSPEEHFENCITSWRDLYKCRVALIQRCEKGSELDIKKIREAYDALLVDFPFLSIHWIQYAKHEETLSKSEKVMEVFERAVAAVPGCVDIWLSYCKYCISAYKAHNIRRLFERAIGSVGSKSSRVWDLYIEYESSEMAWYNVNSIYTRILRSHIENIDAYFARFKALHDSHALHELLTTDDISYFKSIGLILQTSIHITEADKVLYLHFWELEYKKHKEMLAIKKETNSNTPFQFQPPRWPWNGSKYMIACTLPEFLKLGLHMKEVKFDTGDNGDTVLTQVGVSLLKSIFRSVIQEYGDGFCWGGELKAEDILVQFDGSGISDTTAVITKPATVCITADKVVSDSISFDAMLVLSFTSNGNTVPNMISFFKVLGSPPPDVATNPVTRYSWLEILKYQPLFTFMSTRLRLYRHLHKLLKHASPQEKSLFDTEFSTTKIPSTLGKTVSKNALLAEVYWYSHEEKMKKDGLPVVRRLGQVESDVIKYNVADIIKFIRHFESHAMDNFKKLGVSTDNFEEIEYMIDLFFGFLLPALVCGLFKIGPLNPKMLSILNAYKSEF